MTAEQWVDAILLKITEIETTQSEDEIEHDRKEFANALFALTCAALDEAKMKRAHSCDPMQGHWEMVKIHGPRKGKLQ